MENDSIIYVVWGALLLAILVSTLLAYRSRRLRAKRLLLMELFNGYFRGEIPADQIGQRTRQIADRHFMGSAEFFSLTIAAFQTAGDAEDPHQPHSEERQKRLLALLAAMKNEFGLADRYRIEGWRSGRE